MNAIPFRTAEAPSGGLTAAPGRSVDPSPTSASRPVPSTMLLQGRSVVQIEHNGALYQLRSTRLGKLILTK
jgi:hemin uptake protein HemP